MIHYLSEGYEQHLDAFLAAVELEPVSGARIQTLYNMFGLGYKNVDFWVQINRLGQPAAAISRYGGQLAVSDSLQADLEELEEFIRFQGGYTQLSASPILCGLLRDLGRTRHFYRMVRNGPPFEEEFEAIIKPPLSDVYDLLCAVDRDFEDNTNRGAWHVHTSHLVRHKLGYCVGIQDEDSKLVSIGGVYNIGKTHGVIGGLATLPEEKGQGYAGTICRYLTNQILAAEKTPALYAATESLTVYYGSMGYVEKGRWSEVILAAPQ